MAVLRVARQLNVPLGFGAAFALVGHQRGESYASVARSFAQHARLTEHAEAEALAAKGRERQLARLPLDATGLARRVQFTKAESLVMAVTKVAADTKFSPGYVAVCERKARQRPYLRLAA
jgi:hypothetical protein